MSLHSESELQQVYEDFSRFEPETAKTFLSKALVDDLDNSEIIFALKVASFWIKRKNSAFQNTELFERGEQLLSSWKDFVNLPSIKDELKKYEQCIYSIKKGTFSCILGIFQQIQNQNCSTQKALIFSRVGICYKELGDYEKALDSLEKANGADANDADIIAEMADCNALCGKEKMSKVLFREAFFMNAQEIDLTLLESELFLQLYRHVEKKYKKPEVIAEWIPVEGTLLEIFNVKRELRAIEVGKLKQSIFAIENELKNEGSQPEILVPRLINNYFWLIDHYIMTNEDKSKINENLLKIKLLDNNIFERYTV